MSIFGDAELVEMFVAELDLHLGVLSSGLLELEAEPNRSDLFEPMMRAAHSIKGAANLFELTQTVMVAHEIEDIFTLASRGGLTLSSGIVDVLLASVDLLGRLSLNGSPEESQSNAIEVQETLTRLKNSLAEPESKVPFNKASSEGDVVPTSDLRKAPANLDNLWVERIRQDIGQWLKTGKDSYELDCEAVRKVSPEAIALLSLTKASVPPGLRFFIKGETGPVKRLFEVMGII